MGNLVFQAASGGQVAVSGPNTASSFTIAVPAVSGTFVTTGDTGTVSNTMLATGTFSNITGVGTITTGVWNGTTIGAGYGGTGSNSAFTANGVVYASSTSALATGSTLVFDGNNLGLGVTPSAWRTSGDRAFQVGSYASFFTDSGVTSEIGYNTYVTSSGYKYLNTNYASRYQQYLGQHVWYTAASGSAGNVISSFNQVMTLDSSGNLRLGTTTYNVYSTEKLSSYSTGVGISSEVNNSSNPALVLYSNTTTGNNDFAEFFTENSATLRGSITYNRIGGLVVYNTTSDYRAKTVNGLVQNALSKVALLKPSTGRMNGATQDIDFFVAHELQEVVPSAVIGEKDAVNQDNTPKYQMVDKSALIPLLTAAIQELNTLVTTQSAEIAALKLKVGI